MSVAVPSPARARPRPAPAAAPSKPRRERALSPPRRLTAGGLAWVLVLAAMLGGIVFLNVAALRATIDVSGLAARAQRLQQSNRTLGAQVASLTVPYRIDREAAKLGMVQPSPAARDYVSLTARRPHRHPARAFAR